MKKILILILGLLVFPQLASAQSQRNPCYYTTTGVTSCLPVGTSVTGVGNGPLPVGGIANVAAPTFVEGKVGGLSFDLSGNLRVLSSGGGGGGAVTVANGADVALGTTTDAPATTPTDATAATTIALLKALNNSNIAAVPAGTNIIGKVGIDQTTPGTTNAVALTAGTAIIGKVSIDQTTPGTTNGVQVNAALPAGANVIGHVIADTGSTTAATQATAANLNATVVGTGTFAVQAATQGAVNTTLTDCSSTIASGGVAQNAFTAAATRHGFTIANIDTAEVMWINFTGTAAASGVGSYPLAPATAATFASLSTFTSPLGMGINTALSVIAATSTHKYSCTVW